MANLTGSDRWKAQDARSDAEESLPLIFQRRESVARSAITALGEQSRNRRSESGWRRARGAEKEERRELASMGAAADQEESLRRRDHGAAEDERPEEATAIRARVRLELEEERRAATAIRASVCGATEKERRTGRRPRPLRWRR